MCAILGYISPLCKINLKNFYECHLMLKHRGPDDEGFIYDNNGTHFHLRGDDTVGYASKYRHIKCLGSFETKCVFSHRRLSIIDLSDRGHQPYQFNDLIMTYNGEIYNYVEIRNDLKTDGYNFYSDTDTEVVLKAYHKWGVEAFTKFNGMWALSIFDKKKNILILSRDRFGKKPLFYNFNSSRKELFFASEMKACQKFLKKELDYNSIKKYLRFGENQNSKHTFFRDIKILEPSSYLIFDMNKIEIYRYWDIKKKDRLHSIEELENLLESSSQLRLRCDVPIAAALSGGLDSSTVVSFLNKQQKSKTLHTFTAYFPGIEDKEKNIVDDMLHKIDVKPYFINPSTNDFFSEFDRMMHHQEQPVMGLAVFVHYMIMKEVSKYDFKVYYNGHGGDELFGGYTNHYISFILNDITKFKIKKILGKSKNFLQIRPGLKNFFLSLVIAFLVKKLGLSVMRYLKYNKYLDFNIEPTFHKSEFSEDCLKSDMYNEIKGYPLNEWLQYEDRNTMAFGIESRSPLIDYRIVDYAFSISNEIKFHDGEFKYLLRKIGENRLPRSLLLRKDKQGFTSNNFFESKKFKTFFSDYLMNPRLHELGLFKNKNIKKAVENQSLLKDNNLIWRIFNFSYWLNNQI